jgi:DNA mismatch endonuclease (patch repair protein)
MADIVDQQTRSRMMSGIRSRDTRPEMNLRRALHALGLRYRLHVRSLPGTPDIVFPKQRAAVFVHGCFWHRHPGCKLAATPKTREGFWAAKFSDNVKRDEAHLNELAELGWRTQVVWECELMGKKPSVVAAKVRDWLQTRI